MLLSQWRQRDCYLLPAVIYSRIISHHWEASIARRDAQWDGAARQRVNTLQSTERSRSTLTNFCKYLYIIRNWHIIQNLRRVSASFHRNFHFNTGIKGMSTVLLTPQRALINRIRRTSSSKFLMPTKPLILNSKTCSNAIKDHLSKIHQLLIQTAPQM